MTMPLRQKLNELNYKVMKSKWKVDDPRLDPGQRKNPIKGKTGRLFEDGDGLLLDNSIILVINSLTLTAMLCSCKTILCLVDNVIKIVG
jgi:hypothetical protein